MRSRYARICFLATLLIATPAAAQKVTQPGEGSRIQVPRPAEAPAPYGTRMSDTERAMVALRQFGRCVYDSNPRATVAALRLPAGQKFQKAMERLSVSECLADGELRFSAELIRGAIYSELWRRRYLAEQQSHSWAPRFDPFDDAIGPSADSDPLERIHFALLAMASCVVIKDRANASAVLVLPVASKGQQQAYARLVPDFGPCVDQGSRITMSKPVVEGALAEVLYRSPAIAPATETQK